MSTLLIIGKINIIKIKEESKWVQNSPDLSLLLYISDYISYPARKILSKMMEGALKNEILSPSPDVLILVVYLCHLSSLFATL